MRANLIESAKALPLGERAELFDALWETLLQVASLGLCGILFFGRMPRKENEKILRLLMLQRLGQKCWIFTHTL